LLTREEKLNPDVYKRQSQTRVEPRARLVTSSAMAPPKIELREIRYYNTKKNENINIARKEKADDQ
jgi:hypothetical protein